VYAVRWLSTITAGHSPPRTCTTCTYGRSGRPSSIGGRSGQLAARALREDDPQRRRGRDDRPLVPVRLSPQRVGSTGRRRVRDPELGKETTDAPLSQPSTEARSERTPRSAWSRLLPWDRTLSAFSTFRAERRRIHSSGRLPSPLAWLSASPLRALSSAGRSRSGPSPSMLAPAGQCQRRATAGRICHRPEGALSRI
jgi:hypothetical protein